MDISNKKKNKNARCSRKSKKVRALKGWFLQLRHKDARINGTLVR